MLTLNDGRIELWQWDTGRMLSVDADCSQVHFSNKVFGRSVDVDVVDGIAVIPDILLQTDKELTAWAFVGTAENGYTKISKVFKINKRNKPADYVFTPTDQTTLGDILDRIEDLEKRPSGDVSEEDIQNAVKDYLDKNPVSFEETDPTVPAWAKQPEKPTYTAAEVGALPADTPIPEGVTDEQIKNVVDAYLTENPPEGGIPIPSSAQVGQTIVVKAVDETGKPTEWEAADLPSGDEAWERIAYGTLEAESSIYITKDIDGKPFELTKAVFITMGGFSNTSGVRVYPNDHTSGIEVKTWTANTRIIMVAEKGKPLRAASSEGDGVNDSHIRMTLEDNGNGVEVTDVFNENITIVGMRTWNGQAVSLAGTNYVLYGVRA